MKLLELGEKERAVLLDFLGFNKDNPRCQFCQEKINYKECYIMPPINTKERATILDSLLCFTKYLGLLEREEEK